MPQPSRHRSIHTIPRKELSKTVSSRQGPLQISQTTWRSVEMLTPKHLTVISFQPV